jgi:hypothetical protein
LSITIYTKGEMKMREFEVISLESSSPVCGTCMHCSAVVYGRTEQNEFLVASSVKIPECRRFPPITGGFPAVDPLNTYCGEYKSRSQEEVFAVAAEAVNQIADAKEAICKEEPGVEVV